MLFRSRPGMPTAYALEGSGIDVGEAPVPGIDVVLGTAAPPGVVLRAEPSVPNPFRDGTAIRLGVERGGAAIAVDLFDVGGRWVRRLLMRAERPGLVEIPWDGRDASGRAAPSGVYLYRASASGQVAHGRLVLLR